MTRQRVQPLHGVALALGVDADGPLAGVLVLGDSGTGKSLLALDAVAACPWQRTALVADDAVCLTVHNGVLSAFAPTPLDGLIEVRGIGPLAVSDAVPRAGSGRYDARSPCRLRAAITLNERAPRLPVPTHLTPNIWPALAGFPPDVIDAASTLAHWPFQAGLPARAARLRALMRANIANSAP